MVKTVSRRTLVSSLVLASCFAVSSVATAEEVVLKAVSAFPENTVDTKMFQDWIKKVNEDGKGKVQIRFVGGPRSVPTFEVGNAVKNGVVDLALASGSFYTNVIPEADFLKFAQVSIQEQRKNGGVDYINQLWKEKGNMFYLARFKEYTPVHLYLNKKIAKPDLAGLKIRVTPLYRDFFQDLGASVVTISPGEVYTALERNTVDGYGWTVHGLFDLSWQKQTKYRVDPGFYSAEVGIIVNDTAWRKLSPEQQDLLQRHGLTHEAGNREYWTRYNRDDVERQAKEGMETIKFSDGDEKDYLARAYDVGWKAAIAQSPVHGAKLRQFLSK
jgi:TRAP-type C4-dicarboxylate transport system substrate-binding protein